MPFNHLQPFKLRSAIVRANSINQVSDDVMAVPGTSNTTRSLTATQYLITEHESGAVSGEQALTLVQKNQNGNRWKRATF